MNKKIGLPFWKIGENVFGATLPYVEFASSYGEVVPLMPEHEIRTDLDLLILPGGADVDTTRYGETPSFYTGKPDIFKEHFDAVYLPKYLDAGVPIFSICRGMQSIAVHFGGKLIQHMSHETNSADNPFKSIHKIKILHDNWKPEQKRKFSLFSIFDVNSRHHQAVDATSLINTELEILAIHEKDSHVELIGHKTLPIVGFQAHPEDFIDTKSIDLVDNIIIHLLTKKTSII